MYLIQGHFVLVTLALLVAKLVRAGTSERKVGVMGDMMSSDQVLELLSIIVRRIDPKLISAEAAQTLIDSPRATGSQITEFLRKGLRTPFALERFAPWRRLKLGRQTGLELFEKLKREGLESSSHLEPLFKSHSFNVTSREGIADLALVSPKELGLYHQENSSHDDIYTAAHRQGLNLCPSNLAAELWLNLKDQPFERQMMIAMEPIFVDERNGYEFFCLTRNYHGPHRDKLSLGAFSTISASCGPDLKIVFMRNELAA